MKRLTLAFALTLAAMAAAPIAQAAETTRRSGVGRAAHRRPWYGYHRYRSPFGWGWGWGYSPYGYGPYDPYYPYGGHYGYGRVVSRNWAVVDTDVSPERARVYLDGQYVGSADDFDGYPDYLYLRSGRYRLEFRLEGYESRTITVDARPGVKLDVGERLGKIPGAPRYGSYDDPEPRGGVRRFWGKRRDVTEQITDDDEIYGRDRRYRERPRDWDDGDRAERYADDRDRRLEVERDRDRVEEPSRREEWRGRSGAERGEARLRIDVAPADAAVYVDDRFMGTAQSLEAEGIPVSAGRHTVVVSRPGYRDRRVEVTVSRGETERVEINLER
ncbi:MAG TPA: PEGA domain-containing protein [Thermoanaerobaculia bacterium]|nr:PEGA domain-containing protein [Thermoanaerobaculia bacterium]